VNPLIGTNLGHYKIMGHLASGSMGDVYLAYDEELQIHVAVKVLTEAILKRPEAVDRFKHEARAAARLNHSNVARVIFFNFHGKTPYFAMELIEGDSLADVVERRLHFTLKQYLDIFEQAGRGLRAAAVRGITHRDIKPGNLMVGRDGLVKVVDFGLAKIGNENVLTQTGAMMGTPFYLSPEAIRGDARDVRSDMYSLGATMFHVLVGYPPFDGETPYVVLMKHASHPVPEAHKLNDQFPRPLSDLITNLLAKEADDRLPNYEAFLNALASVREQIANRLGDEVAFCSDCDVNTVVAGEGCSRCKHTHASRERPQSYDLVLLAYRDSRAEARCVEYISKAVGRRTEVVRKTLASLPFKIGHRLDHTAAKDMLREFYELGADVEMRPVREAEAESSSAQLEFESIAAAGTASIIAPVPLKTTPLKRRRRWQPAHVAIGVLVALVMLLGGIVLGQWAGDSGEETPTPAQGLDASSQLEEGRSPGEGMPEEEITGAEATPEGETLLGRPLELRGAVNETLSARVAEAMREAVAALQSSCRWEPSGAPALVLDGERAFRTEQDDRAWELTLGDPVEVFPVAQLDERTLDVAAAHWAARLAVADLAGPDAPPWIALGLAAHRELAIAGRHTAVQDPEPYVALAREESHIPVVFWGAQPGRNPPETVARAESMVAYLVERDGPDGLARFLLALREQTPATALQQVYGVQHETLQRDWMAFLQLRYL